MEIAFEFAVKPFLTSEKLRLDLEIRFLTRDIRFRQKVNKNLHNPFESIVEQIAIQEYLENPSI